MREDLGERVKAILDSDDRAGRFLSLASLVSVLLSAIAVAMAAQRYARRHLDTVALLKCMGASQRVVVGNTVLQLVVIAVITAVLGTALGAITAWYRGVVDTALMALADALLAVPRLVLLLVCAALWQPGFTTVVAVLVVIGFWLPAPLLELIRGAARVVAGE